MKPPCVPTLDAFISPAALLANCGLSCVLRSEESVSWRTHVARCRGLVATVQDDQTIQMVPLAALLMRGFPDETVRQMLLWCRRDRGFRQPGSDGLLSLRVVPLVIGRAGQRLQPVEAGGGSPQGGRGTRRDVPEDQAQPASILHQVRRPPDDQPSATRPDRRVCR